MDFLKWARLSGPFSSAPHLPQNCSHCGCKEFYKQPDFKRSLGLGIVSAASILTLVLEGTGRYMWTDWNPYARWSLVWAPMFAALILDRIFINRWADTVLVCYRCEHLVRGIPKEELSGVDAFDLEIHDRYRYAEQAEVAPPQ